MVTKKINNNCVEITNGSCTTCKDNYYLQNGASMCCADEKALVTIAGLTNYCATISNLQDNCLNYDFANKKCLYCADTFVLNHGRCCAAGTIFDLRTE